MAIKQAIMGCIAALVSTMAVPAIAKPVTDCPLRDMPFSAATPLIDILLSPAARGVLDKAVPGRFDKLPPQFAGTTPPTFAAILALREAAGFLQIKPDTLATIEAELKALPVTAADKVARCARYDNDMPTFTLPTGRPRLLLFEKINGFRDVPSVNAAREALLAMGPPDIDPNISMAQCLEILQSSPGRAFVIDTVHKTQSGRLVARSYIV